MKGPLGMPNGRHLEKSSRDTFDYYMEDSAVPQNRRNTPTTRKWLFSVGFR